MLVDLSRRPPEGRACRACSRTGVAVNAAPTQASLSASRALGRLGDQLWWPTPGIRASQTFGCSTIPQTKSG